MRFPFSLTCSMTAYLARMRLFGKRRFPLVLMLEPLHACNLRCTGCGRIREYADTAHQRMTVDDCLASLDECGAPIVSICGGEPLIYPEIRELVDAILARRKHIYLCTNGVLLAEKLDLFRPSTRFFLNIHLDGPEAIHDTIVQRPGAFASAVEGIREAKRRRFFVYTNTTLYAQTEVDQIATLFTELAALGVDGFMLSPAYGYEAVRDEDSAAAEIFMTRDDIRAKFRTARDLLSRQRLVTSPIYMDFLCGERQLPCAAWANPTRNVCGWKGPCYLVTDAHYETYAALIAETDWDALGPDNDPRCRHCMVHCGFEPSAVLNAGGLRDLVKMAVWQMT